MLNNYKYMSSLCNFSIPGYAVSGGLLGMAIGSLSVGHLKDYQGTGGEWRDKMLKRAAIGALVGTGIGAGGGLIRNRFRVNKTTALTPVHTNINTKVSPSTVNTANKTVNNNIDTDFSDINEIRNNLNNPDYVWNI